MKSTFNLPKAPSVQSGRSKQQGIGEKGVSKVGPGSFNGCAHQENSLALPRYGSIL